MFYGISTNLNEKRSISSVGFTSINRSQNLFVREYELNNDPLIVLENYTS